MKNVTTLNERMKEYENNFKSFLPRNMPIIVRLDGCHFKSFTKNMNKPFDERLYKSFCETTEYLVKNIPGVKFAYYQSDEISMLIRNDDKLTTEPWFRNSLQKILSVSASLATAKFNESIRKYFPDAELATFDSRAFVIPENEIQNYFLWRQSDASRNSLSMLMQSKYSQKDLSGLNREKMIRKLHDELNLVYEEEVDIKYRHGISFEKQTVEDKKRAQWVINEEMPSLLKENILSKYKK